MPDCRAAFKHDLKRKVHTRDIAKCGPQHRIQVLFCYRASFIQLGKSMSAATRVFVTPTDALSPPCMLACVISNACASATQPKCAHMVRSDRRVVNTCMRKLASQSAVSVAAMAVIVMRRGSLTQVVKEHTWPHACCSCFAWCAACNDRRAAPLQAAPNADAVACCCAIMLLSATMISCQAEGRSTGTLLKPPGTPSKLRADAAAPW